MSQPMVIVVATLGVREAPLPQMIKSTIRDIKHGTNTGFLEFFWSFYHFHIITAMFPLKLPPPGPPVSMLFQMYSSLVQEVFKHSTLFWVGGGEG